MFLFRHTHTQKQPPLQRYETEIFIKITCLTDGQALFVVSLHWQVEDHSFLIKFKGNLFVANNWCQMVFTTRDFARSLVRSPLGYNSPSLIFRKHSCVWIFAPKISIRSLLYRIMFITNVLEKQIFALKKIVYFLLKFCMHLILTAIF